MVPTTSNRACLAAIFLMAASLGGCVQKRPVLCIGTGPVTREDVAGIRTVARDLAAQNDAELTDVSERYKTRGVPAELSVGFTVAASEFELTMLSAGTLTPNACFYGDNPQSPKLHRAIQTTVSELRSLGLPVTIENSRLFSELPLPLQAEVNRAVETSATK